MSRFTKCSIFLLLFTFSSIIQANDDLQVHVSESRSHSIEKNIKNSPEPRIEGSYESFHIIRRGETLSHIALEMIKKQGVETNSKLIMITAYELAKYNGITNPDLIIAGQRIGLPIKHSVNTASTSNNYSSVSELRHPKVILGNAKVEKDSINQSKRAKEIISSLDSADNESTIADLPFVENQVLASREKLNRVKKNNELKLELEPFRGLRAIEPSEHLEKKEKIVSKLESELIDTNKPLINIRNINKIYQKNDSELKFSGLIDGEQEQIGNNHIIELSKIKKSSVEKKRSMYQSPFKKDSHQLGLDPFRWFKGLDNHKVDQSKIAKFDDNVKSRNLSKSDHKSSLRKSNNDSSKNTKNLSKNFLNDLNNTTSSNYDSNIKKSSKNREFIIRSVENSKRQNLENTLKLTDDDKADSINTSGFIESEQSTGVVKTAKVGDTNKELETLVKGLINKAEKPEKLPKFKQFQKIVSVPFSSTPLFLQTLENLKIAEERKNLAFSKFLPRVTSSIGGGIKSGGLNNDSSSQSKNLTISQLVYDFGVTSRQYEVTEKEELSSQFKIDQQRTDLLLDIITSFFEVYRAETLLKLSQGFVETRRDFLDSVKTREELGGSSNADVIRAETKLSEALDRIPTEVQNLKNSQAVFNEYFDTNPSIKTNLHQMPRLENITFELDDNNFDKNFKIAQMVNQIRAAELNFEAEKRSRFGKFGLQAGYQNTDTNLNTPQEQSSILLTYQIDVFSGFESKAKISQASLKVNSLRYELERMKKELIKELSQAEYSYEAQSALVLSRVALVKGAELSNQVNRELFELNKTSINDLFRSQEEFLTAAKNLVDATVEKNLSFYRLAAEFGTLLNLFELRT